MGKKIPDQQDDLYLNYLDDLEIARIFRERSTKGDSTPLSELAEQFGLNPDDYR